MQANDTNSILKSGNTLLDGKKCRESGNGPRIFLHDILPTVRQEEKLWNLHH